MPEIKLRKVNTKEKNLILTIPGTTKSLEDWGGVVGSYKTQEYMHKPFAQEQATYFIAYYSGSPISIVENILNKYKNYIRGSAFIKTSYYKFETKFIKIWTFLTDDTQENRFKIYDIEYMLEEEFPDIIFEIIPFKYDMLDNNSLPIGFNKVQF